MIPNNGGSTSNNHHNNCYNHSRLWWLWLMVIVVVTLSLPSSATADDDNSADENYPSLYSIPPPLSPFGTYPNPLALTEADREGFAPVVKFPRQCWQWQTQNTATKTVNGAATTSSNETIVQRCWLWWWWWWWPRRQKQRLCERVFVCQSADYTAVPSLSSSSLSPSSSSQLATELEVATARSHSHEPVRRWKAKLRRWLQSLPGAATLQYNYYARPIYIGRYDENRIGLYESDLFLVDNNNNNSSSSNCNNAAPRKRRRRTVHVGIDLVGRVGTPVHALDTGTIHAVGYNPALGDYGNVIVLQHELLPTRTTTTTNATHATRPRDKPVVFYALYGHLDDASLLRKQPGDVIRAGQVLGWMGDVHDCGGWKIPHVHFQLSLEPPLTHDMPGTVTLESRHHHHHGSGSALLTYPDPRYVLGALH